MKKILSILAVAVIIFCFAACNTAKQATLGGSLTEILNNIYATADVDDDTRSWYSSGLAVTEVNDENAEYFIGKAGLDIKEAIASEPRMSSIAYSVCLIRANSGADIEQIKSDIKSGVNPFKWVCVGVEPDKVIVDNIGDVIILIMDDNNSEALHNAFKALAD